jgi:hypothetical protein
MSLRTFGWLCYHEAAWRILSHDPDASRRSPRAVVFLTWRRERVVRAVNRALLYLPERQHWP